jgi:glutamate synthase domain-containing protein 2
MGPAKHRLTPGLGEEKGGTGNSHATLYFEHGPVALFGLLLVQQTLNEGKRPHRKEDGQN